MQQELMGMLRRNTSMSIISHAWAAPAVWVPRHSLLDRLWLRLLPLQLLNMRA